MYECSLERMTDKIKTMSQFGDAGHGGITSYSLSPEALQARGELNSETLSRQQQKSAERSLTAWTDLICCQWGWE